MESQRLSMWVQLVTGVAVLLGLGLVIWELRQTRDIAEAQLISDGYSQATQVHTSMFGEQAAEVLAKSCENPEELSDSELQVLFRIHLAHVNLARRIYDIDAHTTLFQEGWKSEAQLVLSGILACLPGRALWQEVSVQMPQEFQSLGNEMIQGMEKDDRLLDKWRKRMVEGSRLMDK